MKRVISFDPGLTNFAVWLGSVFEDENRKVVPITHRIEKFDIKQSGKATYEAVADTILSNPWMIEPDIEAVVETQDMRNVPARIVGTTIYGVYRGLSIPVTFSGAKLKNDTMDLLATQYEIEQTAKPTKEEEPDAKRRRRILHDINKKNSKAIVSRVLRDIEDIKTGDVIANAKDPQGKVKADDLTDAILLGIGLLLRDKLKSKKRARTSKL